MTINITITKFLVLFRLVSYIFRAKISISRKFYSSCYSLRSSYF